MHDPTMSHDEAFKQRTLENMAKETAFLKTNANYHYFQYPQVYSVEESEKDEVVEGETDNSKQLQSSTSSILSLSSVREQIQDMTQRQFTSTRRSFNHPEFDCIRTQLIDDNRERFKLIQIHRNEQRDKLNRAKMRRAELQKLSGQLPQKPIPTVREKQFLRTSTLQLDKEVKLTKQEMEHFEKMGLGLTKHSSRLLATDASGILA